MAKLHNLTCKSLTESVMGIPSASSKLYSWPAVSHAKLKPMCTWVCEFLFDCPICVLFAMPATNTEVFITHCVKIVLETALSCQVKFV